MPELPEVETIARILREGSASVPGLVGQEICACQLTWHKTLAEPIPEGFPERLAGQVIRQIGRRGKYLLFELDDQTLIIHLRMSGDMRVVPVEEAPAVHDRFWLEFRSGFKLVFNDARKFGRVWLTSDRESVLGKLGPDPFSESLTAASFHALLSGRKRSIKPLLLDQSIIAGIGNIYADEALFRAGIHPQRLSHTISKHLAAELLAAIREVLQLGIENNGASIDWVYRGGGFQNKFLVYAREGQPCPNCGTAIVKIKVGQRGTHFCPRCQI